LKHLFLAVALFAALPAKARIDNYQSLPPKPLPPIVAEVEIAGGMRPPQMPWSTTVAIHSDGSVYRTEKYHDHSEVIFVGKLSPSLSNKINSAASSVENKELIDPTPGEPGCMDAPSTIYSAFNKLGPIPIFKNADCKDFGPLQSSEGRESLLRILKNQMDLSNEIKGY
jgi:hypothetical protein